MWGSFYLHLGGEIRDWWPACPDASNSLEDFGRAGEGWTDSLPPQLSVIIQQALSGMPGFLAMALKEGWELLHSLPRALGTVVVTLLATFFISRDKGPTHRGAKGLTPLDGTGACPR